MTNAETYLKIALDSMDEMSRDDRYFIEDVAADYDERGKKALKGLSSADFKRLRSLAK